MKVSALNLFLLIFLATLTGCTDSGEKTRWRQKLTLASSRYSLCMEVEIPEGLMGQPGMQDLMSDLPEFEFFFADALTTTACAINAGTLIPQGGRESC